MKTTFDPVIRQRVLGLGRDAARLGLEIPAPIAAIIAERERLEQAEKELESVADIRQRIANKIANGDKVTASDKTDLAVADDMRQAIAGGLTENLHRLTGAWAHYGDEVRPALDEALAEAWAPIAEVAPRVKADDTPESLLAVGRHEDGRALLDVDAALRRIQALRRFQAQLAAASPVERHYLAEWEKECVTTGGDKERMHAVAEAQNGNAPRARQAAEAAELAAEARQRAAEEREERRTKPVSQRRIRVSGVRGGGSGVLA